MDQNSGAPRYRFAVLDDPAALKDHLAAWEDLARAAIEPNVFYEPWMLLPAIEAFSEAASLRFVLVYAERPGEPARLCAFFPLERMSRYRQLPLRHLRLWKHKHCFLCTPLIRREHARECLAAFLVHMATDPGGAALLEWPQVAGDGPFHEALAGALRDTGRRSFVSQRASRAVLRRRGAAEALLAEALPARRRKEFRRLERRLAEQGGLRYTVAESAPEQERWIRDFLALEAGGWKGARGSAFACSDSSRRFFSLMAGEAARRGRLMALGLSVGGRPIALKCNLLAGDGAFAFKIAYDEAFAKFSPGTLLELENIRRFHLTPALQWMDSCAEPDHFMANRLWLDRRTLVTAVSAGNALVGALSLLRRVHRSLRRASPVAAWEKP